ncbi:MAG TPA: DUF2071 domain-containing protein [Thermoanaerobaculia bacterium]|jgi:hypothetical protein|nr:DUF2071 domain-containing protein [Thermoanaerobaculia bacterium]
MRVPKVHGVIRRRLLVNFRVDADVAQRQLPQPFRPKLHDGHAVAGICLIRLEDIRPLRFPRMLGLSSENAAHRFAVTWTDAGGEHEGVYIPRRDSGSLLNQLAGGRLFPGEHHRARFDVVDTGDRVSLRMTSSDQSVSVHVDAAVVSDFPSGSIFPSLADASAFFEPGSLGYSATSGGHKLDGVVLRTHEWKVDPLRIDSVASSYFADESRFPPGSATFDCALIMRNIAHEWHSAAEMYV